METTNILHVHPTENEITDVADENMDVDYYLKTYIHPNGLLQWITVLLLMLSTPAPVTFPVYANSVPSHRCRMEAKVEQYFTEHNLSFSDVVSWIAPDETRANGNRERGCHRYAIDWENITVMKEMMIEKTEENFEEVTESCPYGYLYKYDSSHYSGSVAIEFETVCDRSWLLPLSTSIYMIGMMIGFVFGGWSGDTYGRKRSLIGFSIIEFVAGFGISLAPSFTVYILLRAMMAMGNIMKIFVGNILMLELTTAHYRSLFTCILALGLDVFYRALMSLYAYLIPNWRWLNVTVMLPNVLSLIYVILLPESPRYLISQMKIERAMDSLIYMSRVNHYFGSNSQTEYLIAIKNRNSKSKEQRNEKNIGKKRKQYKKTSLMKICFKPQVAVTVFRSTLVSASVSTCYIGMLLFTRFLRGSLYLNAFLSSLMSIPGILLTILCCTWTRSRKRVLLVVVLIAFAILLSGGLYSMLFKQKLDLVVKVCTIAALLFVNIAFCMTYVYIPELFSSDVRTFGFGLAFALGRIGPAFCSYINILDDQVGRGFPLIIYALLLASASVVLFFMEDTNGSHLPNFTTDNVLEVSKHDGIKTNC